MQPRKIHFAIRRFRPEFDCSAIGALYRASINELARNEYPLDALEAWSSWGKNMHTIAVTLSRGQTIIAQHSGRIAGFAQRHPRSHVNMLYTHPDFARCGIGRALLEELLISARREQVKHLTVDASRVSRALFENAGFVGGEPEWVEREKVRIERFPMQLEL